jgi:hypothetical protein
VDDKASVEAHEAVPAVDDKASVKAREAALAVDNKASVEARESAAKAVARVSLLRSRLKRSLLEGT